MSGPTWAPSAPTTHGSPATARRSCALRAGAPLERSAGGRARLPPALPRRGSAPTASLLADVRRGASGWMNSESMDLFFSILVPSVF